MNPAASPKGPSNVQVALLATALLVHHAAAWAYVALTRGIPAAVLLDRWDANIYSEIARHGYSGDLFAFYPLYPLSVRVLAGALGALATPQFVGAAFSTALFLAFIVLCQRSSGGQPGLKPETGWGWALFLFSPASYVFHSHHTESLFLLLSFASLYWAQVGRPVRSGLAAALSALTRNQGIFVGLAACLLAARRGRRQVVLTAGPIALAVLAFLLLQYRLSGDPFAFVRVQHSWSHADSLRSAVATFWFGNAWQTADTYSWGSLVFFLALAATAVLLARKSLALSVYVGLSLVIQLAQGELVHAFRYGAVLFPVLFAAGDWLARMPRPVRWGVLVLWVVVNHNVTRRYALGSWAY